MLKTNEKWFVNLANEDIPDEIIRLLQHGERFSLPIIGEKKKVIYEFIKNLEVNLTSIESKEKPAIRNMVVSTLKDYIKNNILINNNDKTIQDLCRSVYQYSKHNKDMLFTRADKGSVTVAIDRATYNNKMQKLLQDREIHTKR